MIPGASDSVNTADKEYRNVVCGEPGKIGRGQLVRLAYASDLSSGAADGVTVMLTSSPSHVVYGVAVESAAQYQNLRVQVGGLCDRVNTDGDVTEGDLLQPCYLPGVATAAIPIRLRDLGFVYSSSHNVFGVALDNDSSATLSAAWLTGPGF